MQCCKLHHVRILFFFVLKAACQPGEFSPTGLANCEACPINSYQSLLRQTSCIQCPGSSVTLGEGTKSISGCGSKFSFRHFRKNINPTATSPVKKIKNRKDFTHFQFPLVAIHTRFPLPIFLVHNSFFPPS